MWAGEWVRGRKMKGTAKGRGGVALRKTRREERNQKRMKI